MSEKSMGMPESILRMIDENSGGAFFLIYTDETGEPHCNFKSDNATMQSGLIQRLKATVEALSNFQDMDQEVWKQTLLEQMGCKIVSSDYFDNFDDLEDPGDADADF